MKRLLTANQATHLPTTNGTPIVRFTDQVMKEIGDTVGRHPPETFGILGGDLDDPLRVTDYRFCPPRKNRDGSYDHGGGHVNVDESYMNWVIDNEWKPAGKYILGIIHSHPANYRRLSQGHESTNEGDIVFFRNCLRHDDSPGRRWKTLIAPIITFQDEKPNIDVWLVTLDNPEPVPAKVETVDDGAPRPFAETTAATAGLAVEPIAERLKWYSEHIKRLNADTEFDEADRNASIEIYRKLRDREFGDIVAGSHPLGQYQE